MMTAYLSLFLIFCCLFALLATNEANQIEQLKRLIKSKKPFSMDYDSWAALDAQRSTSPVYVTPQDGLMEADKINGLPGQPNVDFNQYGGYVTVDPKKGRTLFYYFVESPQNSSMKPLLLWLNGGSGCSSVGGGAMQELGPFRVNADAKTLHRNKFSWNNVANVLFLESPAGVGFSYSNTTSDYKESGDKRTAEDSYTFLVNWFERFPQYKGREFFITGESYAGHYGSQLASTIHSSSSSNHAAINLRGIAIANALIDDVTNDKGEFEFMWNHAMIPDEVYYNVLKHCNFSAEPDEECEDAMDEIPDFGDISSRNIYSPPCHLATCSSNIVRDQAADFDPCSGEYALNYLNDPPVQKALHAIKTDWRICNHLLKWNDAPDTVLPIIKQLISNGLPVWLYSGDVDALVPITSTRKAIRKLALTVTHGDHGIPIMRSEGSSLNTKDWCWTFCSKRPA